MAPKKQTPKVKITGSISASGGGATGTKSVTRGGSMAQNAKIVEKKPSVLRTKVVKAATKARDAQEYSTRTNKVIKTQPASAENKRLRDVGNRRALDAGRTATRGKIQLMNSMKPKAAKASAKTTVYKPKQASAGQQVAKAAGKVIGRAKSVAREVRDIPTAVAGAGKAFGKASQKGNVGGAAGKARGSVTNIGKQFVEIGKTAVTGKKGTTAAGKKRK